MYERRNDLASTTRRSAVELFNEHLADAIDLHLQAKQAHWNIKRSGSRPGCTPGRSSSGALMAQRIAERAPAG